VDEGVNGPSFSLYVADDVKPLTDLSGRHTAGRRARNRPPDAESNWPGTTKPPTVRPALWTGSVLSAPEQHASRGLSDDIIVPSDSLFAGLQRGVGVIR